MLLHHIGLVPSYKAPPSFQHTSIWHAMLKMLGIGHGNGDKYLRIYNVSLTNIDNPSWNRAWG